MIIYLIATIYFKMFSAIKEDFDIDDANPPILFVFGKDIYNKLVLCAGLMRYSCFLFFYIFM